MEAQIKRSIWGSGREPQQLAHFRRPGVGKRSTHYPEIPTTFWTALARRLEGGRADLKKMGLEDSREMAMDNYDETTLQPGDVGRSCGIFTVGNREPKKKTQNKKRFEKGLSEVFERGIWESGSTWLGNHRN